VRIQRWYYESCSRRVREDQKRLVLPLPPNPTHRVKIEQKANKNGAGRISAAICGASLALLLSLPVRGGDEHPVYPKGFVEAAAVFKDAPATNRYDAGADLMKMLPTTPITGTNRPIDYKARGSWIVTHDYTKPSYLLTESEARRMLGSPSSTNSTIYSYLIQRRGATNLQAFLLIEFYNGHAVSSGIY
jgi:hypothetical protein